MKINITVEIELKVAIIPKSEGLKYFVKTGKSKNGNALFKKSAPI